MSAVSALSSFVDVLERVGVPYMLTGSYASSYHSVPRATIDLDFVVAPTRNQIRSLVAMLPKDHFYVDEGAALEALDTYGQFNAIHTESGWKADFIIRKPRVPVGAALEAARILHPAPLLGRGGAGGARRAVDAGVQPAERL